MLWVGEQHSDKHNMEGDEENMETIAPVAKSMIAPSQGVVPSIVVEKRCGRSICLWRDVAGRDVHFRLKGLVPILW